jgi:hypothetical protein
MSSTRIFVGKRVDESNQFITLRDGEISVDLVTNRVYVHDGRTPGGVLLAQGAQGTPGVSITDATVDETGHLILSFSNNTTLDAGNVIGPAGTGTNTISTGTSTVVVGWGLVSNPDGTISVNSSTVQSLLPVLEINTGSQSTTQITNNLLVSGLIQSHSLTVTNAIIFPDGTIQTTAGGGGGGVASLIQSATAPAHSTSTLWYDTIGGRSYVFYDNNWVDASPELAGGITVADLKTLVAASTSFADFQARIAAL